MRTYGDLVRVSDRRVGWVRDILLVVMGSLLVGLSAGLKDWTIAGVPVTLQTFAVLVVGAVLGRKRGAAAMLFYLAEGAAGAPVFAGPVAMTAGYLVGFPVAAYVVGALAEQGWDRRFGTALAALLIGDAVIFAFGLSWLAAMQGPGTAFEIGLKPFILPDLIKILAAALLLPTGWKFVGKRA